MKRAIFSPVETGEGEWWLNVPAEFSSTGKRRRLFSKTQREAHGEAARVRRFRRELGTKTSMLSAGHALDAGKAREALADS